MLHVMYAVSATGALLLCTLSIGVSAATPDEAGTADALISEADRALYEAKVRGRKRCAFCPPGGEPAVVEPPRAEATAPRASGCD